MLPLDQFLENFRASLVSGAFVKFTLSQPRSSDPALRNLYGRPVELRAGRHVSFVWHYATRDVTKNLSPADAASQLRELLEHHFAQAHLFTTTGDWKLQIDTAGPAKLKASKPAFQTRPATAHDRQKTPSISPGASPFLQALGVTTPDGTPRPGMADKFRQIQRFAEILGHLLDASPLLRARRDLRVVDMGAGKGYLTFAAAEFLRRRGVEAAVTGVEVRPDLVDLTNRVARESGFPSLTFVRGTIGDFTPPAALDLLIALHACNTATDDALFQGISAGASLIITAPCCHQEIRPQLAAPPVLQEVLRHGILLEREAEILTDGIRALLLEIHGYQASVFEFVSLEHTGRNLMIAATKRPRPSDPAPLRARLSALLQFYGLREQRLARLLGEL